MPEVVTLAATLIGLAAVLYQLIMLRIDMRLSAERNVISAERELWTKLLESPDVAPKLLHEYIGDGDGSETSATEILFTTLIFGHYEMIFREHRNGVVSDKVWDSMSTALASTLAVPSVSHTWQLWKIHFDSDFVGFVESNLTRP